ncbi:MAG: hypothetical protein IMX04_09495 [Candidatus Carbobacillus altaicus]|uniref:Putative membrane protein n=1 Tax=Candidatus Carbonibacillus altaicus TaxID=2163959 RepID=A0A2R6Y114_9BACL|nr:hypothetical protein [Candidatus Carbobacillus altaicus]PTQ56367.1 MAG: putative membrane protein [Candidatus Carbobacillus altaicus]
MRKKMGKTIQMGISGGMVAVFIGSLVLHWPWDQVLILGFFGMLLSGGLFIGLVDRLNQNQGKRLLAVSGLIPGFLIGGGLYPITGSLPLSVLFGLIGGVIWFGGCGVFFIRKLEALQWYVSYNIEIITTFILSIIGTSLGLRFVKMIYTPYEWLNAIFIVILPLILSLCLAIFPGVILARNHRRPTFAATLGLISGAIVSWIGINVAPLLFLPGSGLLWAGLITGGLMILVSIFGIFYPQWSSFLGGLMIFFSILSFVGAAGGLIIGGLLGIYSGSLMGAWVQKEEKVIQSSLEGDENRQAIISEY